MTPNPFADLPVIARLPPEAALARLEAMGEPLEKAEDVEAPIAFETRRPRSLRDWLTGGPRPWQHTAHTIGFLPAAAVPGADGLLAINGVGETPPDPTLKNARVSVRLNALRVAAYPGAGIHRILFDFYARNQTEGGGEDLHFNATYRAREGESAPILGYPIFNGLSVGTEGVAFRFHTVNVKNDDDESILDFLEGDSFKAGLKLATTAQPAIAPLSSMALGVTKALAARNRNVSVQDMFIGLDFSANAMGARLAEGDVIAVQIPETLVSVWDWSLWAYDRAQGRIVDRATRRTLIPYNYVAFSVTRYEDA
jgi:hypothetical protein